MNELVKLTLLFTVLLLIGYVLSSYIYHKKNITFRKSDLEIKVLLWIPIYTVYIVFLSGIITLQIAIIVWVLLGISLDLKERIINANHKFLLILLSLLTSMGMLSSLYLFDYSSQLLLSLVFASVVSDVFAFFFGNFFGVHKLPKRINPNKSWEGVIGQFVGAFIGILLLNNFVTEVAFMWAIIVGIGTALGDLGNSYVKRLENFKDWSNRLPGHGGYIDRFSSLGFALLLSSIVIIAN